MNAAASQKAMAGYAKLVRRMAGDPRMLATHVSLYTALFICWQRQGFIQPFSISLRELMGFSKITSIATYHKCIKELDDCGYICYQPSYHPRNGSLVYWPEFIANS